MRELNSGARPGEDFGREVRERFSGFQGDVLGCEFGGLAGERLCVARCGESDDLESVGLSADDVEGLTADAAGRAKDGEAASHRGF